ncbi:MAG TPA: 4-hydroxyphenylpyruvate dioxygenase, partial [Cyanobacteria bacterium UBA8553]|nr:4-hydroxyphenylpyruvate dioxygenase [Cyanobacteria bacterium UBA8553]
MKIAHIHFYVEDANATRDWFVNHMGFQSLASGTSRHTHTTVVKSGTIYMVLSSPLTSESPVAQFLRLHPPGVADVAFVVSDLEGVMKKAVAKGVKVWHSVEQQPLAQEGWKWAKIAAWGSLSHTLIEGSFADAPMLVSVGDRLYNLPLLPKFSNSDITTEIVTPTQSCELSAKDLRFAIANSGFFSGIDHVVLNVGTGELEQALTWYEDVLGFRRKQAFKIQTDRSGLHSQVMIHPDSGVQLPINEPASTNSQIQEFLDVNQGPGVQHIALHTPRIVQAIAQLRHLGLSFLPIPQSYYTQLQLNHPNLPLLVAELEEIAAQQILVDWRKESAQALLLQTFTQPIFKEPTFFFELIERRQEAQGFGEGNFR